MKLASTFRFALALMLMLAGNLFADNRIPLEQLYDVASITFNLQHDKKLREELKLTKDQEKVFRAYDELSKFTPSIQEKAKLTGPDKDAKLRALHVKKADEFFAWAGKTLKPEQIKRLKQVWLQKKGVWLFDHPEIRADLKMDDAQVKNLKAAHDKLREYYEGEFRAGRISQKEAYDITFRVLNYGVPDKVRALLTDGQRKKLHEMLGAPYDFLKK